MKTRILYQACRWAVLPSAMLAILMLTTSQAVAQQAEKAKRQTPSANVGKFHHEGTVVNAGNGKLAMTIAGGLPHTHLVAPNAKITVDGKPAKLEDLQRGDQVQVTSQVVARPVAGRAILSIDGPALEIQAKRPEQPKTKAPASKPDEKVALGVAVAPSPSGSPLVVAVAENSPAESAGIQQGDYITAVDKQKLDSFETLQKEIGKKKPGETAKLSIWRSGKQRTIEVKFPKSESQESTKLAKTPWLGLMLETASDQLGASIGRVFLRGPAAEAGLMPADRIIEIEGQAIDSPRAAARKIAQLEPGQKAKITVFRDGKEKGFTVEVGNLGDFHERLFGANFRERFDDFHKLFDPDFDGVPQQLELLKPVIPREEE